MSRAAEMRVTESNDGLILILISRAVLINLFLIFSIFLVQERVRVRTELNHSERNRCAGKCVSHSLRTGERLDILDEICLCEND